MKNAAHRSLSPEDDVFSALQLTPYDQVNVFLVSQDPYHDNNQAHGLCFSVRPGIKPPPSLANMFIELRNDVGFRVPNNGYLVPWAEAGHVDAEHGADGAGASAEFAQGAGLGNLYR